MQDDESSRLLRESSPFSSHSVASARYSVGHEEVGAVNASAHSSFTSVDGGSRSRHLRQFSSGGLPERYGSQNAGSFTTVDLGGAGRHARQPSGGMPDQHGTQLGASATHTGRMYGRHSGAGALPEHSASRSVSGAASPHRQYGARFSALTAGKLRAAARIACAPHLGCWHWLSASAVNAWLLHEVHLSSSFGLESIRREVLKGAGPGLVTIRFAARLTTCTPVSLRTSPSRCHALLLPLPQPPSNIPGPFHCAHLTPFTPHPHPHPPAADMQQPSSAASSQQSSPRQHRRNSSFTLGTAPEQAGQQQGMGMGMGPGSTSHSDLVLVALKEEMKATMGPGVVGDASMRQLSVIQLGDDWDEEEQVGARRGVGGGACCVAPGVCSAALAADVSCAAWQELVAVRLRSRDGVLSS